MTRTPKNHELKTDPAVFADVQKGFKRFEIRKDDRGYEVGDTLTLRQTKYSSNEMVTEGYPLEYTGDVVDVLVTHILRNSSYGLVDGYAILSIKLL